MVLCILSRSIVVFTMQLLALGVDMLLGSMQTPVERVVIVMCVCVPGCGICLFGWWLGSVWLRCVLHVCPVESQGCWMCLCVEQQRPLMICASLRAQLPPLPAWHFCPCAFEKVEHIIHRQGHMPSSRPPLLHPHNACCHAHSCQLVPVCLPMPITAGQFTFSAHNSRPLCPRCGHMQAPSGKKNCSFFFLPFWHAGENEECASWQANTAAVVCSCVCITICLHRRSV